MFAELSAIAYKDMAGALNLSKQIGFSNANFFDHKGARGFIFETKEDLVVSCRGTQPNKFSDIKADIKLWPTKSETFGHVHKGFKHSSLLQSIPPIYITPNLARRIFPTGNICIQYFHLIFLYLHF